MLTVKCNTPALFEAIGSLDWAAVPVSYQAAVPVSYQTEETGYGRREKRTIQVPGATDEIKALFPHVSQVFLIERYVTRKARKRRKNSRRCKTVEVRSAAAALCECGVTSDWMRSYQERKHHLEYRTFGIAIGRQPGPVLDALCDNVRSVHDLAQPATARDLFRVI